MLKRLLQLTAMILTLVVTFISASITATATNTNFTTLNVNGEAVIGDELAKTNMNKPFWKRNVYVLRP